MEPLISLAMVKAISSSVSRQNALEFPPMESLEPLLSKMTDLIAVRGVKSPKNWVKSSATDRWQRMVPQNTKSKVSGKSILKLGLTFTTFLSDQARDFTRRIDELVQLFGLEALSEDELDLEHQKYLLMMFLGNTIPQLKYATNWAFSHFHKVDYPEGSVDDYMGLDIFPRRLKSFIRRAAGGSGPRRHKFWILFNTLFQGFKKGLLPCEPEIIQKSLDKHRIALTKDPSISESLSNNIERMVEQLFEGYRRFCPQKDTLNQSSHSTSVVPYKYGGNVGFVRDWKYNNPEIIDGHYEPGDLHTTVRTPELIGYVRPKNKVEPVIPVYSTEPIWISDVLEAFPHKLFSKRTDNNQVMDSCLEAIPACILEPMKVRLITKPGLGLHTRMHKLQKSLRKYLYGDLYDIFALTGEPLDRSHLWRVVGKGFSLYEGIVSGDYSAATDNLKGEVTSTIVKELLGNRVGIHDPVLYQNCLESLKGVRVLQTQTVLPKFPEGSPYENFKYSLEDFEQQNGQLMGHVLSFIILCIANYCSYWLSLERYLGKELSLTEVRRHPCLINGDDILFKSNSDHYQIWMATIKEFGFMPSIGKNFFTQRFAQVNSELYRIDTSIDLEGEYNLSKIKELVKIPYANFGLICNRRKQDCSIDLTVQRTGIEELEDSLIGRVQCYPSIYKRLMEGLRPGDEFTKRTKALFDKHQRESLLHFGLLKYKDRILCEEELQDAWRGMFDTGLDPDILKRSCLGDLSTLLDRGQVGFRFERLRQFEKFALTRPILLKAPKEKEVYVSA